MITYKGIEITGTDKSVQLVHSNALINVGIVQNENTDYLDKLLFYKRADVPKARFDEVNKLYSVVKMDYQICNGGIAQYFANHFHEHYITEDKEVEIFDKNEQVKTLKELHSFACEVFSENLPENSMLYRMISFFESLKFEENVPKYDIIYSNEEEQIWDEELEELVDNPDYEEPYEDIIEYCDEITTDLAGFVADDFDDEYYHICDYLAKVIEAYAQYLYKSIEKEERLDINGLIKKAENVVEKSAERTCAFGPRESER